MIKQISYMILAIIFFSSQTNGKEMKMSEWHIFSEGNITYHMGTGFQKNNTSPFLFFKSGQSAGLNFSIAPKKGTTRFNIAADYILGNNDKSAMETYAKENKIEYANYKFTIPKPRGFSIMAGPKFMLFPKSNIKKLPLMWFDFKAGAMFSNQQTLQFFQGQTTPSKEIKSNSISFVYNPTLIVNVVKTKKVFVNVKAGYSNWGGFVFGVSITVQDCRGAICERCPGVGCNVYTKPKEK